MSYQVLARKWRPRRFDALVGQDHVRQALQNALASDRLHHAYLFTGTRGVGKTTIARLLAKALNCEAGPAPEPCGECPACGALDAGRFLDLIEVDAASRTGVDDTRELLESAQYAPTAGRYKVYLIDEVHMFSKSSFNALLKTLEEPPGHVKFLLATTDPQKIPPTILSRCLQFQLRALPAQRIAEHLAAILSAEDMTAEPAALAALARAARGSVRDALSLLDQALAHGGGTLSAAQVQEMLGTLDRGHALRLLDAVAAGDAARALAVVDEAFAQAADPGALLEDVLGLAHQLALMQVVPEAPLPEDVDGAALKALAGALPPEQVQLIYQIALHGRRDLALAPDPRVGLEMVLLRWLAFRPEPPAPAAKPQDPARRAPTPAPSPATSQPRTSPPAAAARTEPVAGSAQASRTRPVGAETAGPEAQAPTQAAPLPVFDAAGWAALVESLELSGVARAFALQTTFAGADAQGVDLALEAGAGMLHTPVAQSRLEEALCERFGRRLRVRVTRAEAELDTPARQAAAAAQARAQAQRSALLEDPVAQALAHGFEARLVEGSLYPTDGAGGAEENAS